MKQYIPVGAVNRELARRRRIEDMKALADQMKTLCTGLALGILLGLAICLLH